MWRLGWKQWGKYTLFWSSSLLNMFIYVLLHTYFHQCVRFHVGDHTLQFYVLLFGLNLIPVCVSLYDSASLNFFFTSILNRYTYMDDWFLRPQPLSDTTATKQFVLPSQLVKCHIGQIKCITDVMFWAQSIQLCMHEVSWSSTIFWLAAGTIAGPLALYRCLWERHQQRVQHVRVVGACLLWFPSNWCEIRAVYFVLFVS